MRSMTKKFVQKNIKLSLEFDKYLAKHPELYDEIPDGAVVVITLKYDKKFTADSISIIQSHYTAKQPIVKAEKARRKWSLSPLTLSPA
jgi:hypothetical protein